MTRATRRRPGPGGSRAGAARRRQSHPPASGERVSVIHSQCVRGRAGPRTGFFERFLPHLRDGRVGGELLDYDAHSSRFSGTVLSEYGEESVTGALWTARMGMSRGRAGAPLSSRSQTCSRVGRSCHPNRSRGVVDPADRYISPTSYPTRGFRGHGDPTPPLRRGVFRKGRQGRFPHLPALDFSWVLVSPRPLRFAFTLVPWGPFGPWPGRLPWRTPQAQHGGRWPPLRATCWRVTSPQRPVRRSLR